MKHGYNECSECEAELRVEHPWSRNSDDMLVCENCADEIPKFSITEYAGSGMFYGMAEHGNLKSNITISGGCHETSEGARKEIVALVRKVWGDNINPIEEGEL